VRTNSAEFVREALISGLGIGLRPMWDIAPQVESGELKVVLPQYRGSNSLAIYAVYPCRDYLPEKVNVFIDFLSGLFANEQWSKEVPASPVGASVKPRGGREAAVAPAKSQRKISGIDVNA